MKTSSTFQVIIAILISEAAGIIGSVFTSPSIPTWYAGIIKPTFSPPNWVFGPVWTTLFALMGIASYIVWKKGFERRDVRIALGMFALQLILNVTWSLIFFGLQNPALAFLEIIALWLAIALTIVSFYRINKNAAYLLIPYILWVSFAMFLNYTIWSLN